MATRKVALKATSADAGATITLIGDGTTSVVVPNIEPTAAATNSIGATSRLLSVGTQGVVNGRGSSGSWEETSWTEEITLSTIAATTDSTTDLPADAEILGVVARVTTTIETCTNWALGDPSTAARFLAATTDLTAGTTKIGLAHRQGSIASDATGPVQAAAAKLRITTTGSQTTAGKVRVTVFYRKFTAPSA